MNMVHDQQPASAGVFSDSDRALIDQTLHFVAERVWRVTDAEFFYELVKYLGESLGVAYAFCDTIDPNDNTLVQTLALYANGEMSENISYNLKDTPCENVIGRTLCCYVDKVQQQFPRDQLLVDLDAESYAGIPLWAADGTPLGLIAIMDDKPLRVPDLIKTLLQIVAVRAGAELERVQFHNQLQQSEQRFRDFAESSSDWFWEMDANLRFSYFSERFEEITGVLQTELLGKTRQETGIPEIDSDVWDEHLTCLEKHEPFRNFIHPRNRDGLTMWISVNGQPVFDAEGRFQGYRGTGTEITNRMHTETELKISEEKLKDFAESSSDWFWEMDENLRFTRFSGHFSETLNLDEKEYIGLTRREISADGNDTEHWQKHLRDLDDHKSFDNFTYHVKLPSRDPLLISVSGRAIFDDNGTFVGYRGTGRDITERNQLEERFRQSQKMEAVGQLTGGIAHDFNNLLGIMIGNTEMLEDKVGDDEKVQRHIVSLMRAMDRASSLTNRLLAFSCQQPLSPVSTGVSELIISLIDMLHRTLGETINLKVDFDPDVVPALIDPHQFENALINLLINARDAMPDGGSLTIVTANTTLDETNADQHEEVTPGAYVRVTVTDTGSGMTPEVRDRVFEPFFTTKEFGEGSGLGLSMVYGFVKQSNGHVDVESKIGKGTTVSLYLPAAKKEFQEQKDEPLSSRAVPEQKTILLVEDNQEVRETTASTLGYYGYEVIEAKDGQSALDILTEKSGEIDLVFTDVVMPNNMSGIELAEKITEEFKGLKVLLTSGYPDKITDHANLNRIGIKLLAKPYKRGQLIAAIEEVKAELPKK